MTFESELQGRCKREGTSILITKTTRLAICNSTYGAIPVPMFALEPGILGSNGRNDARRPA